MEEEMVSHRFSIPKADYDFIKEYKSVGRTKSLQEFVREAITDKIKQIRFMEDMELFNKIKTQ